MLRDFLLEYMAGYQVAMLGVLFACLLTFVILSARLPFLPQDQGRAFAVNGELSKGKQRGVGLIISFCAVLVSILFIEVTAEYVVFYCLFLAIMLSGYLDDAAKVPWSDYKKGLIDLVISIMYMVSFVQYNSTDILIFDNVVHIPEPLYIFLGIVLIWVSINVVNCTDGVDGLCGSLSIVSIFSFIALFNTSLGDFSNLGLILMGCILAYIYFNISPSSMLMGDAGSRAFGFFIAVMAMKSGHPLSFLVLVLVMILDGGLGLVKIFLLRFFKIKILKNTRTPLHDEVRKNRDWSDMQVVVRFSMVQIILACILYCFV